MQSVLDDFERRVLEVDQYLKVLERLEKPDVILYDRSTKREKRVFEEGSLKVMKASVFLVIYNLVESAIRSAFSQMYAEIVNEGLTGDGLRTELRQIWIGQRFRGLDYDSASARTFRELTEQLIEEISAGTSVQLDERLLPVSGNLDSDAIRGVCHRHGVQVRVHRNASGGAELRTVRDQRNSLSHGNASFSDCGQQYTVSDLIRIKRQAVIFIRGILKNIKTYTTNKQYVS